MPQISVIVPVYKVEPYLRQCVDSVLAQTFRDFELILVDDGSPDNCGAICDEYAAHDTRVRVIHKENGGLGNARNVGMDAATGKYILFLDSDDFWDEKTLEVLFAEAEKNQLELLFFSAEPFWDGMEPEKGRPSYTHTKQNGSVKNGPELMRADIKHNEYYPSACLRLFLLPFIQALRLRFDEGILHEDESFSFLSCLAADRAECIGDRLYKRRFRPGSIMTAKSMQNSAHGYAVAMHRILCTFHPESMDSVRDLYYNRFRVFSKIIYGLYKQSKHMAKHDPAAAREAKIIASDAQPVMRRVKELFPEVRGDLRLAAFSMPLAYQWENIQAVCKCLSGYCFRVVRKVYRSIFPQ